MLSSGFLDLGARIAAHRSTPTGNPRQPDPGIPAPPPRPGLVPVLLMVFGGSGGSAWAHLSPERGAIPAAEIGRRPISALKKFHQRRPPGRPIPAPPRRAAPGQRITIPSFGVFVLPYEAVRQSADPEATLMEFFRALLGGGRSAAGSRRARMSHRSAHATPPDPPNAVSGAGTSPAMGMGRVFGSGCLVPGRRATVPPLSCNRENRRNHGAIATASARDAVRNVVPDLIGYTENGCSVNSGAPAAFEARPQPYRRRTLIALGREKQLVGHLERALNNGLTKEELSEVITHLAFYAGWPAAMTAALSPRTCSRR